MPVLERAFRMSKHECMFHLCFGGIAGYSSYWGVVVAFEDELGVS
jgi:hypothetical protein